MDVLQTVPDNEQEASDPPPILTHVIFFNETHGCEPIDTIAYPATPWIASGPDFGARTEDARFDIWVHTVTEGQLETSWASLVDHDVPTETFTL